MADNSDVAAESGSPITNWFAEIVQSPLNFFILVVIALLTLKLVAKGSPKTDGKQVETKLPKLQKDFTPEELKKYDGTQADGRILIAVNGFVYDVTEAKQFYGPGGPYAAFAGRDASRGLAKFSVECNENECDDLSDLTQEEVESLREWELQFQQKYEYVGALLKPGEKPSKHS